MARFEFGKGKTKTYWDIEQLGRVVRAQDTEPHCARLPGFRTFPDEQTARSEIGKLVGEHLGKGFVPADDAARVLAAAVPLPAPKKSAPITLPVRRDLNIYNEANGFMVLSMKMAGVAMDEGSAKWNKAVTDAKMIPVLLFQDDPFTVRVVAGDQLTPQESEEWVARVDWRLNIPDGKLAITGGAVLVNEEYNEDDPYYKDYLGVVELPAGFYRAAIYSYVPGVNGNAILDHLAGGDGKDRWEDGFDAPALVKRFRPGCVSGAWGIRRPIRIMKQNGNPKGDPATRKCQITSIFSSISNRPQKKPNPGNQRSKRARAGSVRPKVAASRNDVRLVWKEATWCARRKWRFRLAIGFTSKTSIKESGPSRAYQSKVVHWIWSYPCCRICTALHGLPILTLCRRFASHCRLTARLNCRQIGRWSRWPENRTAFGGFPSATMSGRYR